MSNLHHFFNQKELYHQPKYDLYYTSISLHEIIYKICKKPLDLGFGNSDQFVMGYMHSMKDNSI